MNDKLRKRITTNQKGVDGKGHPPFYLDGKYMTLEDLFNLILQEKKALLNTITAQINAMHDDVLKDDWVSQDNLGVALDEGTQLIYDETKKELEEEL